MTRLILAAALAAFASAASAQPEFDSKIDKAAAAIVAGKIGEIRGGFAYDQMPQFVRPVDWSRRISSQAAINGLPVASVMEIRLR